MEDWYNAKAIGKAGLLVYCKWSQVRTHERLAAEVGYKNWFLNPKDASVLKDISSTLVIITDDFPEVMRGTDTRSSSSLHLLIAASLPNERAYVQALGRIGRGGDKGTRSRLVSTPTTDASKMTRLAGLLNSEIEKLETEKKEAEKERRRQAHLAKVRKA